MHKLFLESCIVFLSCLGSSPRTKIQTRFSKVSSCYPAHVFSAPLPCILICHSSQPSTTGSSTATPSGSFSSGGTDGGPGGRGGPPNHLLQYANASARSDPWTPYSMDRKRIGKLMAELDIILTQYQYGGAGSDGDGDGVGVGVAG